MNDIASKISEEDKLRAAYALNMCTVSISQIVDYKDLNILEQEYDAILNNLNLEHMPKDDALLHILKQLLDTITYFRIEPGERMMIEKEYQQKMKNAIWSSVPSLGMLVAGGNLVTTAISLASQVGIGYMNYRRKKSEYVIERDRKEWELQKTAIEQFNGLRRELFDTAWRLADTYDFPDEYRLTEKQISKYNNILIDTDEVRKYERLESIKSDFEAYPPFWYFIGNSANYISRSNLNLSDESREEYRKKAILYFERFETFNKYNLLRQDQLIAACALEHIDILLMEEDVDYGKVSSLLENAVKCSKTSNDIIELCAMAYLKIGERDHAAELLRNLVNEDYNKIVNAQLLSRIYVYQKKLSEYELLATRVDTEYLYPMPYKNEKLDDVESRFAEKQKHNLKLKYKYALRKYFDQYSILWNRLTSEFDMYGNYTEPDTFYLENSKALSERKVKARLLFSNNRQKLQYQDKMANAEYELNMLVILNKFSNGIFDSQAFSDVSLQRSVEDDIREKIIENKDKINDIQNAMVKKCFGIEEYLEVQNISLSSLVGNGLQKILNYATNQIDKVELDKITYIESNLILFCNKNSIQIPEILLRGTYEEEVRFEIKKDPFGPELFGANAIVEKKHADYMTDMQNFVSDRFNEKDILNDKTVIYFRKMPEFDSYFLSSTFNNYSNVKKYAFMVIKDETDRKYDLIFTTNGIVSVKNCEVWNMTPYNEVKLTNDNLILYRTSYKAISFDINKLYAVINQLKTMYEKDILDRIEYIDGIVTVKKLNEWFRNRNDAMNDDAVKVYAIPTDDIIKHLGFQFDESLDQDNNLLQYYYNNNTNDILGFRVVHFDDIDSNFQACLIENNGILKVK